MRNVYQKTYRLHLCSVYPLSIGKSISPIWTSSFSTSHVINSVWQSKRKTSSYSTSHVVNSVRQSKRKNKRGPQLQASSWSWKKFFNHSSYSVFYNKDLFIFYFIYRNWDKYYEPHKAIFYFNLTLIAMRYYLHLHHRALFSLIAPRGMKNDLQNVLSWNALTFKESKKIMKYDRM